jgi:lysozyme
MADLINGIDVSRWQGINIDWNKVKSDGYLFTFVKASDGSAYKRQFIEMGMKQANDAKNAGLKIGYYHFAHPNNFGGFEKDAKDEAEFFVSTVKEFPKPNFPLVLDLEDEQMNLNKQETKGWIEIFQTILKNAGFDLMLYSSKRFLDMKLAPDHNLGNIPLWMAIYPRIVDLTKFPKCPIGWDAWNIWQYAYQGKVNGITGNVDLNIMLKDFFDKYI